MLQRPFSAEPSENDTVVALFACVCLLFVIGDGVMSRRRVSVKDLGQGDCQGFLYKRKESKGLLGWRWKKFWFVLKKCSLYWYTSDTVSCVVFP